VTHAPATKFETASGVRRASISTDRLSPTRAIKYGRSPGFVLPTRNRTGRDCPAPGSLPEYPSKRMQTWVTRPEVLP
jgi:hypothetical protein